MLRLWILIILISLINACGVDEQSDRSTVNQLQEAELSLDNTTPGRCKINAAAFRSEEGGCTNIDIRYAFSQAKNGYTFAQADAYCTNLVEGGFDDWTITRVETLKNISLGDNALEVGDYMNGMTYVATDGHILPINFWMAFGFLGSAGYNPRIGNKPDPNIEASVICARRLATDSNPTVERILGYGDRIEDGLIFNGFHLFKNAQAVDSPYYIYGSGRIPGRTEAGAGIFKSFLANTINFRIKIPLGTTMNRMDGSTELLSLENVAYYSGRKMVINSLNTSNSFTDETNDGRYIKSVDVRSAAHGGCYFETNYFKTTEFGCTDQTSGLNWYTFMGDRYDGDGYYPTIGEPRSLPAGDFDLRSPHDPERGGLDAYGRIVKYGSNFDAALGRPANVRTYPETDLLGTTHENRALQLAQIEAERFYVRNRAQKLCDDLNANQANGLNDWRLPTVDELKKLHSTAKDSLLSDHMFAGNMTTTFAVTSSAGNSQGGSMVVNIATDEVIGPYNKSSICTDTIAFAKEDECFFVSNGIKVPIFCDVIASMTCSPDAATNASKAKMPSSYTMCVSASQVGVNRQITRPIGMVEGMFLDLTGRRPLAAQATAPVDSVARALIESDRGGKFITEHLYRTYLGRDAEKTGLRFWADKLTKKVLTPEIIIASFFGSKEYFDLSGGTNESFINALYFDILKRQADTAGVAFWLDKLKTISRTNVALGFTQSAEFKANVVTDAFIRIMKRYPTSGEISQFSNTSFNDLMKSITDLGEYRANLTRTFDDTMYGSAWVRKMFPRLAGRQPTATEVMTWTRRLYEGKSPLQVANEIVLDPEAGGARIIRNFRSKYGETADVTYADKERYRASAGPGFGGNSKTAGGFGAIENYYATEAANFVGTSLSNAEFVDKTYRAIAARAPTAAELQRSLDQMSRGLTRLAIADEVLKIRENSINYINEAFRRIYQREPSSFEYAYWVDQVRRKYTPYNKIEAMMAADVLHWK